MRNRGPRDKRRRSAPGSALLLKRLGQLLFRSNPTDLGAGEAFKKAAAAGGDDVEAHFLYGQWACMNNLNDLCATELNKSRVAVAIERQRVDAILHSDRNG